ncbi:MAG: LysM peptidoglycan-binding domain-containing protein [Chloroflexi bacterium]|nr:LysM peptidoglycan-binding domain-containing protein [Chloroflexota bacterium]
MNPFDRPRLFLVGAGRLCAVVGAVLTAILISHPARADSQAITHTIAWGETLYSIARVYNLPPESIARANNFPADSWVYAGQRLAIPADYRDAAVPFLITPSGYYSVRAGDSLESISTRLAISIDALASANDLPRDGMLYVGWLLKIPGASATRESAEAGSAATYIVQRGDTLSAIALRLGSTIHAIALANNLPNLWLIYTGQRLKIPRFSAPKANTISAATPNEIRLTNVPLFRQQQTLTCEEAAAAMASRGRVTEAQLLAALPRNDNPFMGIRGRTNAPVWGGLSDYGVYAPALKKSLASLGVKSEILSGQDFETFKSAIVENLRAGRAIVWWHTWQESYQAPVLAKATDGAMVKLVPYEHSSVIVGANERGVIYHDPYDATVRVATWADFKRVSAYFDNMALVIY